ncbi:hypothetical protein AAG906_021802 [Vitis piasezkii]
MKGEESSSKAEQGSKTKEAEHLISRCQNFAHLISRCENFAHPIPRSLWNPEQSPISISAMAKTRGGLSASPSSSTPRPHRAAMGGATSPPVQAPAIPHPREAPSRPISHQRPPTDPATSQSSRELFLGHRREPSSLVRRAIPRTSTRATYEDACSVDIPPETVIRRPMIAGPPIEGNLDCEIDPSTRDLF